MTDLWSTECMDVRRYKGQVEDMNYLSLLIMYHNNNNKKKKNENDKKIPDAKIHLGLSTDL